MFAQINYFFVFVSSSSLPCVPSPPPSYPSFVLRVSPPSPLFSPLLFHILLSTVAAGDLLVSLTAGGKHLLSEIHRGL